MSDLSSYLVIGSGSIARRHIANLKKLYPGTAVACISASGRHVQPDEVGADVTYLDIKDTAQTYFKFAIVASPSPFHLHHATELLNRGIPVLIEKPLSNCLSTFAAYREQLITNQQKIGVAYNLRYLTSAVYLKKLLEQKILGTLYSVFIDVGQYLPDWRPASDYRSNVSAQKKLGGGVLLELSHEIDYLTWLFGPFDNAFCNTRTTGALEIDVEDRVAAILSINNGLIAQLNMDFLQRAPTRVCKIVGEFGTLVWNLLNNSIELRKSKEQQETIFSDPEYDYNRMYLDQLVHFSKVGAGGAPEVGLQQGLYVLQVIDALKRSAESNQNIAIGDFIK
ncbi:Gfo/Idh/MocA family oxidoreductase [uncultured Legionella sp.]|mgnify:CR=1 FL=1|uniref:Gfo/Idh/MocA family protein n=1 Tax=uncultured Legionella sp. TaxID=210934 RepID=UPI00262C4B8D|nr:Gfo/Idh/MocA family oxidoreductase [uncultured Legionella sp.]